MYIAYLCNPKCGLFPSLYGKAVIDPGNRDKFPSASASTSACLNVPSIFFNNITQVFNEVDYA